MVRCAMGRDANHATIKRAFERSGATVVDLHTIGGGVPDLLIGFAGADVLVEIKLPTRKLRDGKTSPRSTLSRRQVGWHHSWRGCSPAVVRTEEDVEELLDLLATRD